MKTIKILFILFLINSKLSYSQSGAINTEVPNQIPPTPEAFKFAMYGEIPINESSGNAIVDIPLYTYNAGRISIPLSMFHGGGGVKVDDANTWTGIKWQLNVGGLISRTVNDLPDENVTNGSRLFFSSEQLSNFQINLSPELVSLTAPTVDSEVDIFNYNFLGYSGSFYLDELLVPRLIKYDKEIKIELSENAIVNGITTHDRKTIIITTTDGTKYFFGGLTASESTRIRTGPGDFSQFAQTGFYLYKIENVYGDIATFNYETGGNSMEIVGYSQRYSVVTEFDACMGITIPPNNSLTGPNASFLETSGKVKLINIQNNRDNTRIEFISSLHSENLNRFVLDNVIIYNNNEIFKKIDLNYITPNTINTLYKRFYLEEIKIYEGTNTTTDNIHSFEYNNPELLPDRFSKAQDYAGYYNGKLNNNTYIPKTNSAFFEPYQSGWADKTVDFNKTLYGSLKKVIYPTKGFTEFEYETGINNSIIEYELLNRFVSIYHVNSTDLSLNRHIHTDNSYVIDDNSPTPVSILNSSRPINVHINANVVGSVTQHHKIKFTLDNMNNSTTDDPFVLIDITNADNSEKNYFRDVEFDAVAPGIYTFKLEYYNTLSSTAPQIQFTFNASAQITFSSNNLITHYKPGLRIKNIKNFTDLGTNPIINRYYYNKAAKRNDSIDSQRQVRMPQFEGDSRYEIVIPAPDPTSGLPVSCTVYQHYIESVTQNNIYMSDNNDSLYEYVTVSYGGDNFEKGGKETSYFVQADIPLNGLNFFDGDYVAIRKESNNSLKNGTILNETYFSSDATFNLQNGIITTGKVKEITNTYLAIPNKDHRITNCYTTKVHNLGVVNISTPGPLYIGNHYFGYYYTFSWWHTLESTKTKEYFSNGIVENTIHYFYDSELAGLPSRIISNSSTDILETRFTYPTDISSQPFMSELIGFNRIEQPVIIEIYKNSELLDTKKIVYSNYLGVGAILPLFIQTIKGGSNLNLEDKIVYHRYDEKGYPLEISLKDGTHTAYIWGYNNSKIIAKIDNITYTEIESYVANLQNLSDTGSEANLITALNNLRANLPTSLVTSYTYFSLLGVSTVTDPKGNLTSYEYDTSNRLKAVYDKEGNKLSENQYNYRTQN